jgi:predicted RNA-binding Zn-ribbon protein involved in translation (DUF1610 family)
MVLNLATSVVACPNCGYVRPDEIARIGKTATEVKAKGQRPVVIMSYRGEIQAAARAAFESGQDSLFNGVPDQAIEHFKRAADLQPDFVDAHLWIAKTASDPATKRNYLDNVLARQPNHLEAIRMMMVLNGRLTTEQAARTYDDNAAPVVEAVTELRSTATALLCPQCGGQLTIHETRQQVECASCGYVAALPGTNGRTVSNDSLTMALLERRAEPVRWNIGRRTFQCRQCGAQHTITAERMTARCRFCGSNQVILGDSVGSFVQPDGMVLFKLSSDQAMVLIEKRLSGLRERATDFLLPNNKIVEVGQIEGVYLPFWVFDADVEVSQSRTTHSTLFQDREPDRWIDMMNDIAVCAMSSIPESIANDLDDYRLSESIPYEPRWLAKVPAQVYTIEFDQASLRARERVAERMRLKYRAVAERSYLDEYGEQRKEIIRTNTSIRHMTMQLLLLPVWMATLTERDGDVRLAVINGQTGKTAIGLYQSRSK